MLLRALAFFSVMVGLMASLHWYLGVRLIRDSQLAQPWAGLAWTALWGGFGTLLAGLVGGRLLGRRTARSLQWVGFGWMGAFGLLLSAVAASDLALWVAGLAGPVAASVSPLRAGLVVALVGPALVWGFRTAHAPQVKAVEVPVPGLDPALDGFRIVQLSDVHLGETLGRDFAQGLVDQVNGLDADAVVITGDLVDGSVARLADDVAPLAALTSRHGTFFVTGNHEYYSGAPQWMEAVGRLGMTVLHNRHQVLSRGEARLVLGGVPDLQGAGFAASHRPDVGAAFQGAPAGVPRVLLAHQPRMARLAAGHGVSLMLSGHTHGGQMFPFMAFVRLQQPVVAGLHTIAGVLTYTSNGTGYWGPPFRIGPRGEVTVVTLRAR
jgi:predicted MPP superfamily phosphohydrolase